MNFIHPCPGSKVTSNFGWRTIFGSKQWHQGIDYAKSGNVPILASADGIVVVHTSDNTSYGNVVFIQHNINGKRWDTTYAHLKSKTVKKGDRVKQGQIIGYMGNTGQSTGQHLHFEIHNGPWLKNQPNAVDPALYVDKESEEDKLLNELKKQIESLSKDVEELKKLVEEENKSANNEIVADWAKPAFEFVKSKGIVQGTTNGYKPTKNITRQEVWQMFKNALGGK